MMRSWTGVLVLSGILCSTMGTVASLIGEARAAPAPFPRPRKPLTRTSLVGTWEMHWGHVRATVVLSANGDYSCAWPGAHYVGTWGYDARGRFWITESCHPEIASSWQSYAIQFGRYKRAGKITVGITGNPLDNGIAVSLEAK